MEVGKPINPRTVICWLRHATLLTPERSARPQLGDVVIDVTSEPIIPDRIGELVAIEEGANGPAYVVWCSEPLEDGRKNYQTWEGVEIRTIMITPNTLTREKIAAEDNLKE